MIRTQRSQPDPAALAALVADRYGLDVTGCVLLRSLVNDVYRVDTADGPRVLKVYRAGGHSAGDVTWELNLAAALNAAAEGGPLVAPGIGDAGVLEAPEGIRPYALWGWAPGERPRPPFDDALFRRFGAAAARFHAAADTAEVGRRAFAVEEALGRPYAELLPVLAADDRTAVAGLIDRVVEHLDGLDLPRGVCHGDLSLDNLHLDGDRVIFYDLDRAGWGRRAADLTGPASTEHWPAFRAGYRSVRPLGDAEIEALPWLEAVARIGELHFHLVDKPLLRGIESIGAGWASGNLSRLRELAARLG